jgi:hypothetical protein
LERSLPFLFGVFSFSDPASTKLGRLAANARLVPGIRVTESMLSHAMFFGASLWTYHVESRRDEIRPGGAWAK